jgi:chromosome segregation ATPase
MRIQWSSDAAQEMLTRLEQADQRLQDNLQQAERVTMALEEANQEGDDAALKKALERFGALQARIRRLHQAVDDYKTGLRRTDQTFEDAESSLVRLAEDVGLSSGASESFSGSAAAGFLWNTARAEIMPEMRVGTAGVPDWLEQAVSQANTSTL